MNTPGTIYVQGDSALWFQKYGFCDDCLQPSQNWAEPDRFGNFEVFPSLDKSGNMWGYLCPECHNLTETLKENSAAEALLAAVLDQTNRKKKGNKKNANNKRKI